MSTTEELLQRRYRVLGRGSPLFYDKPLHLVRGEGVWLFDADGRRYLDAYNNVPHVGHCHPARRRGDRAPGGDAQYAHPLPARGDHPIRGAADRDLRPGALDGVPRLHRQRGQRDRAAHGDGLHRSSRRHLHALRIPRQHDGRGADQHRVPAARGNRPRTSAPSSAPDSYRDPRDAGGTLSPAAWLAGIEEACESSRASGHGVAAMLFDTIFSSEGLPDLTPAFLAKAAAIVRAAGGDLHRRRGAAGLRTDRQPHVGLPAIRGRAGRRHARQADGQRPSRVRCRGPRCARERVRVPGDVLQYFRRQPGVLRRRERRARRARGGAAAGQRPRRR